MNQQQVLNAGGTKKKAILGLWNLHISFLMPAQMPNQNVCGEARTHFGSINSTHFVLVMGIKA
jgi:hypothetical protein